MDEIQKAEQIGVHKGALATLAKEREELAEEGIDLLSIPWINKDN